jgi:hypothetical protein
LRNEASPVIGEGDADVTSVACEARAGAASASRRAAIHDRMRGMWSPGLDLGVEGSFESAPSRAWMSQQQTQKT